MLSSIAVKSFKSLYSLELELGRINVFIGANGSGKSNLLEAIGVLGAAANGRIDDEALLRRGVRPGVPALYKSSFRNVRVRPSIRLEAHSRNAKFAVELNNPIIDPTPAWQFKNEKLSENGIEVFGRSPASYANLDPQRGLIALKAVELSTDRPASTLLRQLAAYSIYSPDTNTLRGLTHDTQQREPVGLSGGGLPKAVQELLKSARRKGSGPKKVATDVLKMIDWASTIGTRNVTDSIHLSPVGASSSKVLYFKDRYMAEKRNGLTGYDASEGALYVLFAAVLAALSEAPAILAIDNVDHGLNPRLARALMFHLCEWVLKSDVDKQMFLTTHNPLVLDGLPLDDDNVRLFAVGRSRKGHTIVSRVKLSMEDLKKDGDIWTVSRLWVTGHFGGVPDV